MKRASNFERKIKLPSKNAEICSNWVGFKAYITDVVLEVHKGTAKMGENGGWGEFACDENFSSKTAACLRISGVLPYCATHWYSSILCVIFISLLTESPAKSLRTRFR